MQEKIKKTRDYSIYQTNLNSRKIYIESCIECCLPCDTISTKFKLIIKKTYASINEMNLKKYYKKFASAIKSREK